MSTKEKQPPVYGKRVLAGVLWWSCEHRLVTYFIMEKEYAHARRN